MNRLPSGSRKLKIALVAVIVICFGVAVSYPVLDKLAQVSNEGELSELSALRRQRLEEIASQIAAPPDKTKPSATQAQDLTEKPVVENIKGKPGAERIKGFGINLLDKEASFPKREGGLDAIWMSQFLDCFSEEEIVGILRRAKEAMDEGTRLFIMETFWDRQRFEPAAFCLTMTSLYFTAMANGNSKMYHSDDMRRLINQAGLEIEAIYDGLGQGHSIMKVRCKM